MDYLALASEHIADLYPIICYARPSLAELPPGAILGTWAYSVPGKVRFILNREVELAPGVLPADLARAWVRDQYKLPIKRRRDQLGRHYSVPLYARRGEYGWCSYIDIHGAYLQVLRLGFDVEYELNQYVGSKPVVLPPEIGATKYVYSIAVTMSGSKLSDLELMGKDGIFKHQTLNLYSNPCLFALAQDTLNAIGSEMLAVMGEQCVYANTDGYVIKGGYEQSAIDLIASWGFAADIRVIDGARLEGDTEIRGVSSYRIGAYQTRRFDRGAVDFTSRLMSQAERRWLKTRWSLWAGILRKEQTGGPEILPEKSKGNGLALGSGTADRQQ